MFKLLTLIIAIFLTGLSCQIYAQNAAPQAQVLAAALDKTKYKKKEKKDIKIEIYINIKNQPVIKSNQAEYSGVYASDGYTLELKIAADGSAEGSGYDAANWTANSPKLVFTLKDARVAGGVLTATKVFDSGSTERLEAVFVNRTVSSGTNAGNIEESKTTFGLGFVQSAKDWQNRVFLERND